MSKKGIFWSVVGVLLALILIAGGLVYFIPTWREKALSLIRGDNIKVEEEKPNDELIKYENEIKELNSKIEKLDGEKNALVSEIELKTKEHETNISVLNEQLTDKQNELVNAQNRLVELQNDISANSVEIEHLQGEIETLTSDKQDLENQIEQLNSEHEEQINSLNSQIESLTNQKNNLQEQLNNYKFSSNIDSYISNNPMYYNQNFIDSYNLSSISNVSSSEIYNSFNFNNVSNYSSGVRIRVVLPSVLDIENGSSFGLYAFVKVPFNKMNTVYINSTSSDLYFSDFRTTLTPCIYSYSIVGNIPSISFRAVDFYIYVMEDTPVIINSFNFMKVTGVNTSLEKVSYLPFGISEIEYFGDSSLINFDMNLVYNYLPDTVTTYGSLSNTTGEIVISNK